MFDHDVRILLLGGKADGRYETLFAREHVLKLVLPSEVSAPNISPGILSSLKEETYYPSKIVVDGSVILFAFHSSLVFPASRYGSEIDYKKTWENFFSHSVKLTAELEEARRYAED